MKILIIDEAEAVRPRLAEALGQVAGIEVDSRAPSAGGLLRMVGETRPAVVVIDIQRLDGVFELIRRIKSGPHPPIVVALSGSSSIQYRAACHAAGAEYFFDMARDQARLLEAITELQGELAG